MMGCHRHPAEATLPKILGCLRVVTGMDLGRAQLGAAEVVARPAA